MMEKLTWSSKPSRAFSKSKMARNSYATKRESNPKVSRDNKIMIQILNLCVIKVGNLVMFDMRVPWTKREVKQEELQGHDREHIERKEDTPIVLTISRLWNTHLLF